MAEVKNEEQAGYMRYMQANAIRLRGLIDDLLDNARIGAGTFRLERRDFDAAEDDGQGILLEAQPSIFQSFFLVQPGASSVLGGTGLGLSIAKAIVRAHGGRIDFQSETGRGTTFWVFLAKGEMPEGAQQSSHDAPLPVMAFRVYPVRLGCSSFVSPDANFAVGHVH